jgi:hypothetical protein
VAGRELQNGRRSTGNGWKEEANKQSGNCGRREAPAGENHAGQTAWRQQRLKRRTIVSAIRIIEAGREIDRAQRVFVIVIVGTRNPCGTCSRTRSRAVVLWRTYGKCGEQTQQERGYGERLPVVTHTHSLGAAARP